MTTAADSLKNESGLDIPEWLTADFLEKHLQKYYNSTELKVIAFSVHSATSKGENFCSLIFRVKVDFVKNAAEEKHNTVSVIVKAALPDGVASEVLAAHNVFDNEIEIYGEVVPKIMKLLDKLTEPNPELIAETFGVCNANKVMLFEDLTLKGYGMASIQQGFSFDEAKAVLKKLATFHAICARLQEQQPDIFRHFMDGAISRVTDAYHAFFYTQLDALIETISTWPDFDHYTEKLRRLRNVLIERGCQIYDKNPNHFNSLNHGDFWMNNIMIKRETAKSADDSAPFENVVFIDFQDSCFGSSTIDLHYFLNTSLNESLRPGSFGALIESYHEQLASILSHLEFKKHIPTKDEILEQFNSGQFLGFISSCLVQPIMINEKTDDAGMEAMVSTDDRSLTYKRNMYQQAKVQANLRKLIPIYDQMGLFD